jgi:hypothetical protein
MLTKRSMDVLLRVERMMESATRALADAPGVPASPAQRGAAIAAPDTVASAANGARGN